MDQTNRHLISFTILIKLRVLVEQGTYYTSILHIKQILLPEAALLLVLVTRLNSDYLNEFSCCHLLLWGKSVKWPSGGQH
jgi:hypothetical protein